VADTLVDRTVSITERESPDEWSNNEHVRPPDFLMPDVRTLVL
jgi:hypothetical protein